MKNNGIIQLKGVQKKPIDTKAFGNNSASQPCHFLSTVGTSTGAPVCVYKKKINK